MAPISVADATHTRSPITSITRIAKPTYDGIKGNMIMSGMSIFSLISIVIFYSGQGNKKDRESLNLLSLVRTLYYLACSRCFLRYF